LTFQDAQAKLLAHVRDRIHNGELTERSLARRIGISQPHVHNVLKGVRNLSPEIFDSLLNFFQMSLLDLAPFDDLESAIARRRATERVSEIPFLDARIGPSLPWPAAVNWREAYPFPSLAVSPELVMARLGPDHSMSRTLVDSDVALLDTSERGRSPVSPEGLYAVSFGGQAVLRHIRRGARTYYLVTDVAMNQPALWQRLSPTELAGSMRGRVRWLGRERDRDRPMSQRGRFLYDPISS